MEATKAASETLKELSASKKYLGAEIGYFAILHTWGQNLSYHPHIHLVVTGGGLSKLNKWIEKIKSKKHEQNYYAEIREKMLISKKTELCLQEHNSVL